MSTYNLTVGGNYITYGGKALTVGSSDTFVVIGGKSYRTTILPDGNEWLAVNLDYVWDGLSVPTSSASLTTDPQAIHYDYVDDTYGLLYNWYAVKYLDDNRSTLLPEGWRVPSIQNYANVRSILGGWQSYTTKLKSTTGWLPPKTNGTDDYEFSWVPSGRFVVDNNTPPPVFAGKGIDGTLWTRTSETSETADEVSPDGEGAVLKEYQYAVRLIRYIQ